MACDLQLNNPVQKVIITSTDSDGNAGSSFELRAYDGWEVDLSTKEKTGVGGRGFTTSPKNVTASGSVTVERGSTKLTDLNNIDCGIIDIIYEDGRVLTAPEGWVVNATENQDEGTITLSLEAIEFIEVE